MKERSDVTAREVLSRRNMMKRWLLLVVIWTLTFEPSRGQTGCQDINFFCGNWGNRGLCTSQRQFMQEQCPRTCNSCSVTEVLFPSPSIASPDFNCGRFDATPSTFSRQKRQLGNILGGILGSIGGGRPSPGASNGNVRPSIPNRPSIPSLPSIPSFNPFRPGGALPVPTFPQRPPIRNPSPRPINTPQPVRRPSRPTATPPLPNIIPTRPIRVPSISIPNILGGVRPLITNAVSLLPSFSPLQPSIQTFPISATATAFPAPVPTPVGGGTNAKTPSVVVEGMTPLSTFSRQKRQLGQILGGSRLSPGTSNGSNRPSIPSRPSVPSINPFRSGGTPTIHNFAPGPTLRNPPLNPNYPSQTLMRPSRPNVAPPPPNIFLTQPSRAPSVSVPSILKGIRPALPNAVSLLPSFDNFQASRNLEVPVLSLPTTTVFISDAFPTPVGGGTSAETPSVGIVFVVETSRPTVRPPIVRPTQPPVIPRPRPTTIQIPPPAVTRPPIRNPSPVTRPPVPNPSRITPTPVRQPVPETSNVVPLTTGSEILDDVICGSVPITDRFLLSAAHCFPNQNVRYRIRLGELDISQTGESNSRPQDVDIERIFIHPEYRHSTGYRYNDIALLRTAQKIRFSPLVFPLCILEKPMDVTGAPLTVAGFGLVNGTYRSPVLQAAELEGLNDFLCQERYKSLGHDFALRSRYPDLLVGKGILCANAPGRSACQGDSGGPLTIRARDGKQYLVGLVSIGASCLGSSLSILPGLYTDVAFHLDWINEVVYGS